MGLLVLTILMCVGMFLYAGRDLKRFEEQSLEELPEVSPVTVSRERRKWQTRTPRSHLPAETTAPKPLTQHHIADLEPEELEIETPSLEPLDVSYGRTFSFWDRNIRKQRLLVYNVRVLRKKKSHGTDEFQAEIDNGSGFASLISALGS